MKQLVAAALLLSSSGAVAQSKLTPETLIGLKRVVGEAVSPSGKTLYYSVRQVNLQQEKSTTTRYKLNLQNGERTEWTPPAGKAVVQREGSRLYAMQDGALFYSGDGGNTWDKEADLPEGADNIRVSPDGEYVAFSREVPVQKVLGTDRHPDLPKTSAQVYTDLNFRHWDTWEDGKFSHVFVMPVGGAARDIMEGEPYDAPQKPFGGTEDIVWRPDSKGLVYVCKKKAGKAYAISTNTDLYYYDVASTSTENWSEGMMGYDTNPAFSEDGTRLAWLSQARDGFESDKNRLMIMDVKDAARRTPRYMTAGWDETVSSFVWDRSGGRILFNAPMRGTEQLFEISVPSNLLVRSVDVVRQVTKGKWDVAGLIGQSFTDEMIVSRTDHNHAAELYRVNLQNGAMTALTRENEAAYSRIRPSRSELRMVRTTDGKQMGVWVVYPPDFDSTKKYPALLYCQGGPQSSLTQFYSTRWNFALMAAQGYIVVAPNRRGMPGWGTQWNEAISGDWGGQPMRDYLSAIDAVSRETYVDKNRLGCVGASYGGYSVFMLAGMHGNRFKSFIAHDGLFDLKSWYGTTEELWFANFDVGGPYWGKAPSKSYAAFNPSNFVDKWTTPIMVVQGGTDYRVGIEQGLAAFGAAQLKGLKSKLLYLPDENHWVLRPQNAVVWQREFFGWLDETLR